LFFCILGWRYATDGDKAQEFSTSFRALGIVICLKNFDKGFVEFSNADKRSRELVETISFFLQKSSMNIGEAQRLRGRMQFADSQVFGRLGRLCLKAVTTHAYSGLGPKLKPECISALRRFSQFLLRSEPRRIQGCSSRPWFIFTDACFDVSNSGWPCGLGGVVVDPHGNPFQFFSTSLSASQMSVLGVEKKVTIIFEAELLAVVIAVSLWSSMFYCSPIVIFVDNNTARDVNISGSARSRTAEALLECLLSAESKSMCFPWYSRVPSPSNPSDAPSRGNVEPLKKARVQQVAVNDWVENILAKVVAANSANGG